MKHQKPVRGKQLGENTAVEKTRGVQAQEELRESKQISERKQAQEKLRQAHELIQGITQGTEDMIAAEDLDFRYTFFNKAYFREFKKLWGQEIKIGTSMVEAMAPWPENQRKAREMWSRALSGESFAVTMKFGPGELEEQYYDLRFNPLRDAQGLVIGAAHFLRNVMEEVRTRKALHESQRRLALAMEAASLGWWQYDPATRIVTWGERFEDIFGSGGNERCNYESLSQIIYPQDLSHLRAGLEAALDPLNPQMLATQCRIIRPNGELRWIEAHGIALFEGEGENRRATNFVGTFADVTERKKTEEALQRRTEQLSAANLDLESFTYSISHDLRNPLSTIGGFAQIIIANYSERLDEEGRDYLRRIGEGVDKMQRLIDDMLSLSCVVMQEVNREDVDLSTIVHDYLHELSSTKPGRQAEFVIQKDIHANADPRQIHLALENLLRNAWKFTAKKR